MLSSNIGKNFFMKYLVNIDDQMISSLIWNK